MVTFEWTPMSDETFKTISRGSGSSVEVLAQGKLGTILVGRISKDSDSYELVTYLGGGFSNVVRFVRLEELV